MHSKTIRFKQRFQNFEKAFQALERAVAIRDPSETERGGLIQFFEMTFELSWKTMKDYLESEGYNVKSPREVIKQAFQNEMIADGHVWMEMLEERNLTAHLYDEKAAMKTAERIRLEFFPALRDLYNFFKQKI